MYRRQGINCNNKNKMIIIIMFQTLSVAGVALQRGNAVSFLGSFSQG